MDISNKISAYLLVVVILLLLFLTAQVLGFKPCANECGGTSLTQAGGTAYYNPNETGRIVQTSDGGLRTVSEALGRPSTYIDQSGRSRSVNCYQLEYCLETPQCEEECVDEGGQCGYGQASLTHLSANSPFYGECCGGMACINGYCRRDQCVPDGGLCQYGPSGGSLRPLSPGTYTYVSGMNASESGGTVTHRDNGTLGSEIETIGTPSLFRPAYYGECCGTSECVDGYCRPPQGECVEQGQACGYGQVPVTALVPGRSNYYGQCCGQMECVGGVCQPPEEQCNQRGQFCGYGPQTFTANIQSPTYYGDCCGDDQCVNGYCSPPAQNCVQTGGTCGYGPQYATAAAPPTANYYGTCCEGDYCYNGRCIPNQGCAGQGETCVEGQIPCCEGYVCTNGKCATPCKELGGTCRYDSDCCQGYWCKDGTCSNECMEKEGASCLPGRRECCGDMVCSNGRCITPCKKEGSCDKDSDCCEGYYCSENKVCTKRTTGQTCQTSGSCAVGADVCCEGYYCSANLVCTPCNGYGYPCSGSAECCSPYSCIQGYCMSATGRP